MAIQRFEDIVAWQKARWLTRDIYSTCGEGGLAKDFGLKDQIRRASVSIMSNIAEGFERSNPGDFHRFLAISKGSSGELRSLLYVAFDAHYLSQTCFESLFARTEEVSRMIGGLKTSVEKTRDQ